MTGFGASDTALTTAAGFGLLALGGSAAGVALRRKGSR